MKTKISDWINIEGLVFVATLIALLCVFFGPDIEQANEYNRWYNNLSAEEKLEVDKASTLTYEVLGIAKYVRVKTNSRGGVMDTDICYTFEYIDGDGNLKSVDNFEHLDNGATKVVLGDTDAYIINKNGENTRTLQLTKETLRNIQTLNSG